MPSTSPYTEPPPLPAGHTRSRPVRADVSEIFALMSACNTAVIGHPDYTEDEVADELAEPDFDPARDGWLVRDPGGHLVGWGWACRKGTSETVDVDVYHLPTEPAVGAWLWHFVQRRAVELAAGLGHPRAVVDAACYSEDTDRAGRLSGFGFAVATVFYRLFIAHDPHRPRPMPAPPPNIDLRSTSNGPEVRRDAWAVHQTAFADHFGFVAKSYSDWLRHLEAHSTHDWSLGEVAYVDDRPAGLVLRSNAFLPDEASGYVALLAVHPDKQGRGLGRLLLRRALAADAADLRRGTFLHVDTDPSRPALNLYLGEGMRPVQIIDAWRRIVPTARPAPPRYDPAPR
ncbi:GNAT family N-acetyltransferase [Solwaraspora sp. WMMD406]|uniref:GNAT family N-acetyltransferase n=1 Tax=Solwaraspora sp. WMMD406 TaxID=3016095 RepID=UPI0024177E5F|nr:GNAT family N-acetyltransferase [Solwaraspora sp. WMMD406]MDG4766083.1 GNAT family N-acetyltransferase [Solwaraspora sp. WMMD406]